MKNMKRNRNHLAALILALVLSIGLSACGGSGNKATDSASSSAAQYSNESFDMEESAEMPEEGFDGPSADADAGEAEAFRPQDRKLITTVNLRGETRDFDGFMDWIESAVARVQGYIESSELYSYDVKSRSNELTLRVPADKLDGFLQEVGGNCNIVQKSVQEEDVTLNYVDAESYRDALLVEQERLLELLEQATSLEDILNIEDRLTNVRYQLQNYESTLRVYDNQINYSTVYLSIQEVAELTEPEPESWGSRAWAGLVDNAREIGVFFQEMGLFLVTHLPTIGIVAIIVVVVLVCTRKSRKQAKERRRQQKELIRAMQEKASQTQEQSGGKKE